MAMSSKYIQIELIYSERVIAALFIPAICSQKLYCTEAFKDLHNVCQEIMYSQEDDAVQ